MSLAEGLTSALSTFTTIRDENRRSQLHDLKVQNYGLRNEGRELENRFARESYGSRMRQEDGLAEYREGVGRQAQSEAYVAEETEGDLIQQEREKTRYEGNRANYWGSQATSAASDARVAVETEGDRASRIRSLADRAFHDARTAAEGSRKATVSRLRGELANLTDGRPLAEAVQDDRVQARIIPLLEIEYEGALKEGQTVHSLVPMGPGQYGIAVQMPDGSVKPVTQNRSSDPNDPPLVISEEEVAGFALGDKAGDYLTQEAGRQQVAEDIATDARGRIAQAQEGEAAYREEARGLGGLAAEVADYTSSRAAIQSSIEEAEAVIEEGDGTRGRGPGPNRAQLRLSELRGQLNALDRQAEEGGYGDYRTMDEYVAAQSRVLDGVDQAAAAPEQIMQEGAATMGRANQSLRAGATPEEVRVSLANGLRPGESTVQRTTSIEYQNTRNKNLETLVSDATESVKPLLKQFEREGEILDIGASVQNLVATRPEMIDMVNTGEGRNRLKAVITQAVNDQAQTGRDAEVTMRGLLAFDSPAAIDVMHEVADSDIWGTDRRAGSKELRLRAAEKAADLVENQGISKAAAARRALAEFGPR